MSLNLKTEEYDIWRGRKRTRNRSGKESTVIAEQVCPDFLALRIFDANHLHQFPYFCIQKLFSFELCTLPSLAWPKMSNVELAREETGTLDSSAHVLRDSRIVCQVILGEIKRSIGNHYCLFMIEIVRSDPNIRRTCDAGGCKVSLEISTKYGYYYYYYFIYCIFPFFIYDTERKLFSRRELWPTEGNQMRKPADGGRIRTGSLRVETLSYEPLDHNRPKWKNFEQYWVE